MTPEKKRKLRNIAILSLLGLIGGTMAFQAFNQQAINDRENEVQVNVGGRVHDYYNRDTENKDVFVENYGERPIMARIRLSEFLEYQRGDEDFTPLVAGSERNNLATWITWIPSANNINQRADTGNSSAFNRYAQLTFGWSREGETGPWYMPTFNHDNLDLRTAAAGHARDYIAGAAATDGTTDGTTHPGDGTDAYWSSGDTFDNSEEFLPGGDSRLEAFLTGIKNNSINESGTSNPRYEVDSPPSDFNFDTMLPGRVFTMAGEEYLYLEDQGSGNHLIIRHAVFPNTLPPQQGQVFSEWFSGLDAEVRGMVQPVAIPTPVPAVQQASITWSSEVPEDGLEIEEVNNWWLPSNLADFPAVAGDVTTVNPSGTPQAFALSLADVVRLTTPEGPFTNLRTPSAKGFGEAHGAGW